MKRELAGSKSLPTKNKQAIFLLILLMAIQFLYYLFFLPTLGNPGTSYFLISVLVIETVLTIGIYYEKSWAQIAISLSALGYIYRAAELVFHGDESKTPIESIYNSTFTIVAGLVSLAIFALIFTTRYSRWKALTESSQNTPYSLR